MKRRNSRLALSGRLLIALVYSGCSVDSRGLTYEFHALETAGDSAVGGNVGSHASDTAGDDNAGAGEGGAPEHVGAGAASGASSPPSGSDSGGAAGDPSNGESATGGTLSSAGADGGGTAPAGAAPAGAGSAGFASSAGGAAGSVSVVGCADLNQDEIDDCTQTLVNNSRFDSTASDWVAEPLITATWDPSNGSGQPGSGSLLLTNTAPVAQSPGSFMGGADQCIPTQLDASYDVAARIMVGPGQADAAGGINVWMYDGDACKGNLVTAATPILGGVVGQWTVLRGTMSVPGGVRSLSIRLVAVKPFVETEQKVFVDDVLFAKH
jgi:hypothetical protein